MTLRFANGVALSFGQGERLLPSADGNIFNFDWRLYVNKGGGPKLFLRIWIDDQQVGLFAR